MPLTRHFKIASFVIAGWIVIAYSARAPAADVCQPLAQALEDVLAKNGTGDKKADAQNDAYAKQMNLSANMNIDEYRQPHVRGAENVEGFFSGSSGEFARQKAKLGTQDVVYDGGSGAGMFATEIAEQTGAKAIGISAQDFGPRIEKLANSIGTSDVRTFTGPDGKIQIAGVGPYSRQELEQMGKAVGKDFSADLSTTSAAHRAREILQSFVKRKQELIAAGKLSLKTGFVEDELPQMKEPAKLITDVYGATYYSAKRAQIVQEYYNHLTEDGKAFVLIGSKDGIGGGLLKADDKVITANGPVDLWDYLVNKFPKAFSLRTSENGRFTYLVITKDPSIAVLDTGLQMQSVLKAGVKNFGQGGHIVPSGITYTETAP